MTPLHSTLYTGPMTFLNVARADDVGDFYLCGRHLYRVRPSLNGRGPYLHKLIYGQWVYLGRRFVEGVMTLGQPVIYQDALAHALP